MAGGGRCTPPETFTTLHHPNILGPWTLRCLLHHPNISIPLTLDTPCILPAMITLPLAFGHLLSLLPVFARLNFRDPVVLLIIILLVIAVLPTWPYSRQWGYPPVAAILIIILILFFVL